jgi:hypothetical protein
MKDGVLGVGGAREEVDCVGETRGECPLGKALFCGESIVGVASRGAPMVVWRTMLVVSEDGGRGRFASESDDALRTEARQRKHSPVPK